MHDVTRVFDAMAGSYDDLEPWYEHLYEVLHAIVRAELRPMGLPSDPAPRALDVGCGTGYQTAVLTELGYATAGIDLALDLLAVARARLTPASFTRADATALPFAAGTFDAVTCCGSVLSLVNEPARVVSEIGRVLRPGGRALIECEHRWSADLAWMLVNALAGDRLGYGVALSAAVRALRHRPSAGVDVTYPLPVDRTTSTPVRLHLFTRSELDDLLERAGLVRVRATGIHALTNLIPSTVLHRPRLGRATSALYRRLCAADRRLRSAAMAHRIANSLVVVAAKPVSAPRSSVPRPCIPGS